MDNVGQRRNAIIGFIGGVIFMIGDFLLYMFPGRKILDNNARIKYIFWEHNTVM